MKHVIVLNGVARSGKDSLADFIADYAGEIGIYVLKISTVGEIKRISKESFGVEDKKGDKERRLWSDLKDAWTRYNDGPFKDIVGTIDLEFKGDFEDAINLFIVMCREPSEIEKFTDYYGSRCTTVLVERPDLPVPDNHADQNVSDYPYDVVVQNSAGLDHLEAMSHAVFDFIKNDEQIS